MAEDVSGCTMNIPSTRTPHPRIAIPSISMIEKKMSLDFPKIKIRNRLSLIEEINRFSIVAYLY